jgi:Spy/CpxP family protein refolding chaperone
MRRLPGTTEHHSFQETTMRKNSVITALALALTVGAAGVASAQGVGGADRPRDAQQDGGVRRGPDGRGGPETMLLRGITLSADQQAQIKALGDRQRQQWEAERAQRGGNAGAPRERGDTTGMGARRAEMQQRRDQHIAAVRAVLNADQQVQFDKNVAEMKAHAPERGGERRER